MSRTQEILSLLPWLCGMGLVALLALTGLGIWLMVDNASKKRLVDAWAASRGLQVYEMAFESGSQREPIKIIRCGVRLEDAQQRRFGARLVFVHSAKRCEEVTAEWSADTPPEHRVPTFGEIAYRMQRRVTALLFPRMLGSVLVGFIVTSAAVTGIVMRVRPELLQNRATLDQVVMVLVAYPIALAAGICLIVVVALTPVSRSLIARKGRVRALVLFATPDPNRQPKITERMFLRALGFRMEDYGAAQAALEKRAARRQARPQRAVLRL